MIFIPVGSNKVICEQEYLSLTPIVRTKILQYTDGETDSLVINTIFPYADPIIKVYAYLRTKQIAANGLLSRKENELLCDLFDLDYFGLNLDKYINDQIRARSN
ncbi:MAG: hypothetical protein ABSA84_02765 [Gammaproteobacteria bacterium]|jgi:hypothetical protein